MILRCIQNDIKVFSAICGINCQQLNIFWFGETFAQNIILYISFSEQFFCANCKNAYYKRTMRIVKWTILLSKKKGGNQNAYYKRIRTISGAYYKR